MWTGRKLKNDYPTLYETVVCCDTEKCEIRDREYAMSYVHWVIENCSSDYYEKLLFTNPGRLL